MFTSPSPRKRFPTPCRFFAQGICRAGQECLFAHLLPMQGTPRNEHHAVFTDDMIDDALPTPSNSIQKAIRDLEMNQLHKKYKSRFRKISTNNHHTIIEVALPQHANSAILHLYIPNDYPDVQCTIRIQNTNNAPEVTWHIQDALKTQPWHHMRHTTLVQQLDWISTEIATLSQA
ncbi:uncharacterized protein BYT42DRAFT_568946 [Radiomyces spectabilis]|uniref:uncharacterized protein n=1 Tax=Radiomyces spectabilis TaxID=64574 RepID=UPI0022211D4F|nr:uncharacterized protein BYT42DRAFT_568946 [Radiomyces spectabilis]KAI8379478.1 hypothetical protein BYT42DRAFT_568946 [Radiomyces spectabilis]